MSLPMARSGSYAGAHVVEEIAEWLEQNTRTDCHSDLADSLLTAKWLGEGHSEVLHAIPRNKEFSVRAYCERLAQLWLLDQRATNATNRDAFIAQANIALGNTDALSQLGGKAEKVPTAAGPTTTVATWRSVKVALAKVIAQDETGLKNAKSLADEMLRTFCKGANGSTLVMNFVPSHERLTVRRFLDTSFELWTRLDGTSGTQLCEAIKSAISSVPMEHINFLEDADYNRHFRPSLPLLDDDPVDIVPRLCAILDEFVINYVADLLLLPVLKYGKGHILVKNEIPLCQQFSYHVYLSTLFTVWGRNDKTSGKALYTTLQHCHESIGEPKSFSMGDVDFLLDETVDAVLQAPGSTEIKFHEGDWMALAHFELCGIVHGEAIRRLSYCLVQPLYSAIKGQQPMSGDASTLVLDSSPPCCDVTEKLLLWIALCIWRWHTKSPSPEGILSSLRMINFDAHQQCSRLLKHILKPDADFKPEPRKVAVERVQREMVLWKDMYQRLCYSGITSREVDDLASALLTSWKQDQRRDVLELFMPRWLERTASLKLWILILMWMHTNPDEDTRRPISNAFRPINKRRLAEGKTPFQIDLAGLVDCMFLQEHTGCCSSCELPIPVVSQKRRCDAVLESSGSTEQTSRSKRIDYGIGDGSLLDSQADAVVDSKTHEHHQSSNKVGVGSRLDPWKSKAFGKAYPWLVRHLPVDAFRLPCRTWFDSDIEYASLTKRREDQVLHNEEVFRHLSKSGPEAYRTLLEVLSDMKGKMYSEIGVDLKAVLDA